jgi:hypothetical protein
MTSPERQALLARIATLLTACGDRFVADVAGERDETPEEARAFLLDPANQESCEVCGWTYGMLCPECPGCGCYTGRCSGWRHAEYSYGDDDDFDDPCFICGEPGCPGYCDDYETYNLRPAETGGA